MSVSTSTHPSETAVTRRRMTSRKPRSTARRPRLRLRRIMLVTVLLLLVGLVGLEVSYQIWASKFPKLMETGTNIDAFLGVYSKDFQAMQQPMLMSSYAEDARVDFFTHQDEPRNLDDVVTVEYLPAENLEVLPDLKEQIRDYFEPIQEVEKAKFKLNHIYHQTDDGTAKVRVRFQIWGHMNDGRDFYDSGLLRVGLCMDEENSWLVASQEMIASTRVYRAERTFFTDISDDCGIQLTPQSLKDFHEHFRDWKFSSANRLGRGTGVADVDGDGHLDICVAGVHETRLYLNDGNGGFTDGSERVGLRPEKTTFALFPLFADIDNDHDPDLLLLRMRGQSLLLRNDKGRFTDITKQSGLQFGEFGFTAAFADYDNDGFVDLYLGRYGNARDTVPDNLVRSVNGEPDQLFRNRGDGTFQEVTEEAGIHNPGWTLACGFCDIDADGDVDLYAANDFGYDKYFVNQGDGTFSDQTWQAGAHNIGNGMSVSFFDFDEDGDLDLYTSGIASNTIWFQGPGTKFILSKFLRSPTSFAATFASVVDLKRHLPMTELDQLGYKVTQGNSLLEFQTDGTFRHAEKETKLEWAEWAWGVTAEDYDCDGDTDVYVANGFVTGKDKHDL